MKKMLLIFSAVLLVASVASADWVFSETVFDFANGDSMLTHQYGEISGDGYYSNSPHGIVVDAAGNFWIAFYYTSGDEYMNGADTAFYRPLWCFDADGNVVHKITVFDLPGGGQDTLWNDSDHSGTGRGIAMDNNGDILYSSYATLYRFDYETGVCTGKFATPGVSMTDAGQASDGTIYVGHVGKGNPVHMLDEDFNVIGNAIDTVKHLSRSLMVADGATSGYDIYIGSTWSIDGVAKYHSDDPEFDSFVPTDTLGLDWSYDDAGTTVTEGTWASSLDWTLDGNIIWGAIRKAWGGYWGSSWYIVDPETGAQIEQFGIAVDDEYGDAPKGYHLDGGVNGPRGAFQYDENTLYTVDFYLWTVDKWVQGTAIEETEENVLNAFKLEQNYPNPFNPTTKIAYQLENAANVNLTVYNMLGAEVATLVNSDMAAGRHIVDFNASNLSTGVYFCKLVADGKMQTIKMLYMK